MARRSLFIGLTGLLVVVLGYLIVQGRRHEKMQKQANRPVEVVKESKPTRTRVLAPQDLEIVTSSTGLSVGATATHSIVIKNKGTDTYQGVLIKFSYLGPGDRILETQTRQLAEVFQPGQARAVPEIVVDNLPKGIARATARILSADLESDSQK